MDVRSLTPCGRCIARRWRASARAPRSSSGTPTSPRCRCCWARRARATRCWRRRMPSLPELQIAFARGVFDPDDAAIAEFVVPAGMSAAARLAVYRRNVLGNYAAALRDVYPVLLRLVGESFFDRLVRDYATQIPSRSGDLHDFGGELCAFLEALPAARDLPYLADVARLEWAVHRTFHARHALALDVARLA